MESAEREKGPRHMVRRNSSKRLTRTLRSWKRNQARHEFEEVTFRARRTPSPPELDIQA